MTPLTTISQNGYKTPSFQPLQSPGYHRGRLWLFGKELTNLVLIGMTFIRYCRLTGTVPRSSEVLSVNRAGTPSSIYLPKALDTQQPQHMLSLPPMDCTAQVERWVHFGSCGQLPLLVESAIFRLVPCWPYLVALCKAALQTSREWLQRPRTVRALRKY